MKDQTRASLFAYLRNVGGSITAATIIWGAGVWFVLPRVEEWLSSFITVEIGVSASDMRDVRASIEQQQSTIATISETQARVAETVNSVVERIAALETLRSADRTAPVRFSATGHRVSAGRIGGLVTQEWRIVKTRDCGTPRSRAYFVNGGGRVHAFRDKSNGDDRGWTVPFAVGPAEQVSRFSARIPADDGVEATGDGLAVAFLVVDWPEVCPNVAPLRSPEVPFRILP